MSIEYEKMAYLYDKFYAKKNYKNEVEFICGFIKDKNCCVLDAGCGTGNHAKLLHELGYNVQGFDLSQEMVDLANKKIPECFKKDDILKFTYLQNFDLIISFFAVFNHLKNYNEFKIALKNFKMHLKQDGVIIIDLHNPQSSGEKYDTIDSAVRKMKWKKNGFLKREYTTIEYTVGNEKYLDTHVFKIFNLNKLAKLAYNLGFKKVQFFENYDMQKIASKSSKNIQMIVYN